MQYSIRELRARHGERQADTAKSIGISLQTYNAWEKDLSRVPFGKVMALADHFGVSIDEISFCPSLENNSRAV